MTKQDVIAKVKEVAAAPSCYAGLKERCEAYLSAVDTANEAKAKADLIEALKVDVMKIDDVIAFMGSDVAKEHLGDRADMILAHAKEVKANGGEYCDCPACSAGLEVLQNQETL